jgi:cell division protein FtsW
MAVLSGLCLLQPDLGSALMLGVLTLILLFAAGAKLGPILGAVGGAVIATAAVILTSPWRMARVEAFLDPFAHREGAGYQIVESIVAFGSGGLTGVGLGDSRQKLFYLPEAHTDFISAIIGEELGFVGVAAVILGFFWVVRRIVAIGRQAIALDRVFAGLMVQGIAVWFGAQGFVNMGVNLGVLPTKGLTLPLMSYGGSAILMNLIAVALVLRVDMENRILMRGGRS